MTMLSRVLGLVRDIVFARFFGAGVVMDAFFVAFKIPNIFRRFFAEGAFSQSFVPVFAEYDEKHSPAEVKALVDRVAGTLGLALFVFTAIGVAAAPVLISVFGMGWLWSPVAEDADKFALAWTMAANHCLVFLRRHPVRLDDVVANHMGDQLICGYEHRISP